MVSTAAGEPLGLAFTWHVRGPALPTAYAAGMTAATRECFPTCPSRGHGQERHWRALPDDTYRLPRDRDAVKRGIAKTVYKKWRKKTSGVEGKAVRSGAMRKGTCIQTKAPMVRRAPTRDQDDQRVIGAELRRLNVRLLASCCRAARLDSGRAPSKSLHAGTAFGRLLSSHLCTMPCRPLLRRFECPARR